jgi:hypothetical protein
MATSGCPAPQLRPNPGAAPFPTRRLVVPARPQHSVDAVCQRPRRRRLGHVGRLPSPQPPIAPHERIYALNSTVRRRHQRPPQPRRTLMRNPAPDRHLPARIQARRQTRVVHQRPRRSEACQAPDLAPHQRRQNLSDPRYRSQPRHFRKRSRPRPQMPFRLLDLLAEMVVHAQQLFDAFPRRLRQRHAAAEFKKVASGPACPASRPRRGVFKNYLDTALRFQTWLPAGTALGTPQRRSRNATSSNSLAGRQNAGATKRIYLALAAGVMAANSPSAVGSGPPVVM